MRFSGAGSGFWQGDSSSKEELNREIDEPHKRHFATETPSWQRGHGQGDRMDRMDGGRDRNSGHGAHNVERQTEISKHGAKTRQK
jgi:hypothetical protein